jgi:hypothetical protein
MLVSQENIITIPPVASGRKNTADLRSTAMNSIIRLERARQLLADLKLTYNQLSSDCRSAVREQLAACAEFADGGDCGKE